MSAAVPLIDRKEERARFRRILEERTTRLVTIADSSGNGKSRLLKEFHSYCGWEIPASLTLVSIDTIRGPFDLVKLIVENFGSDRFEHFRALDKARIAKNFDPFAEAGGGVSVGGSVGGTAVVAKRIGVVAQAGAHVTVDAATAGQQEWSDEHEATARAECVRVFFEELHELANEGPAVIFLDEFEKCREGVDEWIVDDFLRNHVFSKQRTSTLVVVIAGQRVPDLQDRLGARHDDLVDVIPALTRWQRDDIEDFLREFTGEPPEPAAVDFIEMLLGKQEPIEKVVNIVKAWHG